MANLAEQIRAYELKRRSNVDRMKALMDVSETEGRTLGEEEDTEYESLKTEIEHVDKHLARLKDMQTLDGQTAQPVTTGKGAVSAAIGPMIQVRGKADADEKFPGQRFTQMCIARALAVIDPDRRPPWEIAKARWGQEAPVMIEVMKAGIAGGGTGTSPVEWGSQLVQADTRYTGDFVEFLYSKTVFDQLGLKEVPAYVVIKGQDGTATANWVGESKSIPVSLQDYTTVSLTPLKVAAMCVCSKDLLRYSTPSAEALVRDSIVQACSQKVDSTFLSNTAATAGVSPAGILNGLVSMGSAGYDGAAVRSDLNELHGPFFTNKYDTSTLKLIMHPGREKATSLMANALGQTDFPMVAQGNLLGTPIVTGHNCPLSYVILIDPTNVWRIGDTGIEVSASDQATIEQDAAPLGASDTPTAASATIMSMYGTDSVAFKVVRHINWAKRRTTAVTFMSDAGWGDKTSTTA